MQGRSLAGLVRGQSNSVRDSFMYEYFADALIPGVPAMQGVRTNRWTYVSYPGLGQEELYDLEGDPGELTNQSSTPERLQVKVSMREELTRLQIETNAPPP
jgi:hypothetical protein